MREEVLKMVEQLNEENKKKILTLISALLEAQKSNRKYTTDSPA